MKGIKGAAGIFEMTWADDERGTFESDDPVRQGDAHVVWRRIGHSRILQRALSLKEPTTAQGTTTVSQKIARSCPDIATIRYPTTPVWDRDQNGRSSSRAPSDPMPNHLGGC